MDKYKLLLENYIENLLEKIEKLTFSKTEDFIKGQLYAYYSMVKYLKLNASKLKISQKDFGLDIFDNNELVNIDKDSKLFKIVKKIINEWDPEGLLSCGAPEDEYEPEIEEIIFRIKNENTLNEIGTIVSDVFTSWFNDPIKYTIKNCMEVANIVKNNVK
jgi:hypothetical protein